MMKHLAVIAVIFVAYTNAASIGSGCTTDLDCEDDYSDNFCHYRTKKCQASMYLQLSHLLKILITLRSYSVQYDYIKKY